MEIKCSKNLQELAQIIQKAGAKLYIVGGHVRDSLLGFKNQDVDIASGLFYEQLKELLKDTKFSIHLTSNRMGTSIISCNNFRAEHTTFRTETYADGGAHIPVDVNFVLSPIEDSERRDFTINALYYDIVEGVVHDFYFGLEDLKKKRIKAIVSPMHVFKDDGLRILRMVRFACELDFSVEDNTFLMARDMVSQLDDISKERIAKELKLIFSSDLKYKFKNKSAIYKALELFLDLKLLPKLFKTNISFNMELEDFETTLKCYPSNRLVAFIWDIVKNKPEPIQFLNELISEDHFYLSNDERKNITNIISALVELENNEVSYNFIAKYYGIIQTLLDLTFKKQRTNLKTKFEDFINKGFPKSVQELYVDGNDCVANGIEKEKIKVVLNCLLAEVLEEKINNDREFLLERMIEMKGE